MNINENYKPVYISGGNTAIAVRDVSSIVNIEGGYFTSPNHGGLYNGNCNTINITGGTFCILKNNEGNVNTNCTPFGGIYSSGAGTITVSNSKIIGGSHGIRIKNTSGAANVTVHNTYIEGQDDVLSLAAGTFTVGKDVTVKSKSGKLLEDNPAGTLVDPYGIFS